MAHPAKKSDRAQWKKDRVMGFFWEQLNMWQRESCMTMKPALSNNYRSKIEDFLMFAEVVHPKQIVTQMIQEWLTDKFRQRKSASSIRHFKDALNSFMKFCLVRGFIKANPCHDLKLPRIPQQLPRYLTDDQIYQCLLLAVEHGIYLEVLLALKTGMRLSEMRVMCWEHILWDQKLIAVPIGGRQKKKPRMIPLHPELEAELKKIAQPKGFIFPSSRGGPSCQTSWATKLEPIQKAMPEAFTEGISKNSVGRGWHLFRHTFATRLAMAGVSIFKISKYLGHSGTDITMKYAHFRPEYDSDIEKA